MTTTAFTLLFLPACLAVPAGLALGSIAELMIEKIGSALFPRVAAGHAPRRRRPAAGTADERRELAVFGLCGGAGIAARRDELALTNARRPAGQAPWM